MGNVWLTTIQRYFGFPGAFGASRGQVAMTAGSTMLRSEAPAASALDFSLDEIPAKAGWLGRLSRRHIQTGAVLADLAIIAAAALMAAGEAPIDSLLPAAAILTAAPLVLLTFGLYRAERLIEPARAMRPLTTGWTVIFIIAAGLPALIPISPIRPAWLLTYYFAGLPSLVIARWAFQPFIHAWVAHGHCTKSVAIVGANEVASQLIRRLRRNPFGIRVVGVYDDREPAPGRTDPLARLGTVADLADHPAQIDLVVITLPLSETARISAVVAQLRGKPYKLRILPGLIGLDLLSPFLLQRGELPGVQLIEVRK